MLGSRVIQFFIYGSSLVITSEIAYYGYRCLRKYIQPKEINEVLWTNELSIRCFAEDKCSIEDEVHQTSLSPLNKSNIIAHKCDNIYCSKYNIGRLVQYIYMAQCSIDIAIYAFTLKDLTKALIRASKRGVSVRIINDREMSFTRSSEIATLTQTGMPVRCNPNTYLMHHKFCIIDSPLNNKVTKRKGNNVTRSILICGSLNWTLQGFLNNWENVLITSNKELVDKYAHEFERLWKAFDIDFE